ncbi:hypothetical protein B5F53_16190 [Blautia sp. An249]|uniref:helix-turn-helix domain-containing protein n=1 Tax=Blautia sp. An249 TaxID=1965603 RepID=UPI000B36E8C6|nr:XRE family transcriptional regulator [Blautia sp. An249]OUO76784.1 hypothetical protein B5F53_16190 [Blautia sp. An249]
MIEDIGARVRTLRKTKNMTLTQLSEQTELSPAYISNLERELCSPTLDNIQKICQALGVELIKLLDNREWAGKVIRAEERPVIYKREGKIRYESINFGKERMTGEYIVVEPGCIYDKEWSHSYDEIGYVLEGELLITIGEDVFTLKEGDSFYIDAKKRHNLGNRGKTRCVSLWIKQAQESSK